ncbi:facilitated trehalose transporter Tret1-like [Contarinia nasturtii]|uniref:facilitated trehalose transporter Tret1-like n=1 Tax=Contarinia nasturtii TaxID=265458 RepID=UPI0012D3D375|nr:facilitated trehalose transporter Tret1-like [Contarinia nasturtii]
MPQNYGSNSSPTSDGQTENKCEVSTFRTALPQFCVVGVKNLILLGWGLILGYPTILLPGLDKDSDWPLSGDEISWIGSINLLCVPLGSLTSGLLMEKLGKRRMMQLLNLPMLAAWALLYYANSLTQIYIALGLSGMSGGLLEAPLLLYIADTIQPRYRGMLTASGTATVLGGVCLQFIIGSVLDWRSVALISAIVPFLAFNAVFLVPESPFWLYQKNRIQDAQKSLCWLRGWVEFKAVENEFHGIIRSVEDIRADKKVNSIKKWSKQAEPFMRRGFILPFALIFVSFIFQHFSGITPLQTYAIEILSTYKVPVKPYSATIFIGAAQVIGCLIGTIFVRSTGKRPLVFASFIGCSLCFFGLGLQSYLKEKPMPFTSKSIDVGSAIDNLQQDVFYSINSIRNRMDDEATQNNTLSEAIEKINLLIDFGQNSSQLPSATNQNDTEKLIELLNITKMIILPSMINDENKQETSRIVKKIEQDMWSVLTSNDTIKQSHLVNELNEMSKGLQTFTPSILARSADKNAETLEIYQWMPFILLLCGTTFGHFGAKLFPWMLIGEVYPMDVRSVAAGMSSAIGYLVGFASNKTFVSLKTAFTLDGTFWIYSAVSLIGCVILVFILPETENQTLEYVQEFFSKKKMKRPQENDENCNVA